MSKKNIIGSNRGSSNSEDSFYFFIHLLISILLFFAILNSVVSCIKSPFKNYEILTKWEKSNGVVENHYYDNGTFFMIIYNFYSTINQSMSGFSTNYKEDNIFSSEMVKYKVNNEEFVGKSTNSYLFNFDIDKNVEIYYNPLKKEEIIINTKYRLYVEPILDLIYVFLIFKIVLFLFNSKNKENKSNEIVEKTKEKNDIKSKNRIKK